VLARTKKALQVESLLVATPEMLAAMQEGWRLSPQSHNTYVSHLSAFYDWCVAEGYLDESPCGKLVRPKMSRRLPRPMPEADLVRALASSTGRVRVWLTLAAFAGLRACEIAAMQRDWIVLGESPILVILGKGGRERVVPLAPQALEELRVFGLPRAGYVFGRRDNPALPVRASTVSNMANEYLHSLGIRDTLHTLRHRFGSRFYQESLDLRLTQETMGHGSPVTTAGYAAYSPDAAAAVVRRLQVAS
jgi:integrase